MTLSSRQKIAGSVVGAVLVVAVPFIGVHEGFVGHVYRDSGGVQTYCYGETQHPQPGKTYTKADCDALLTSRVAEFDTGVRSCVKRALPVKVEAAFVSTAYNIGLFAFCGSTLARKANAGDLRGACNEMPRWNRVDGKVLKGLTVRRGDEQALCLEGVAEG